MAARDVTGAVDFGYLETYAGHDAALVDEVLGLFLEQVRSWERLLDPWGEGFGDAAHTLKGSALGIGAGALASVCGAAEQGASATLGERERLAALVRDALDAAVGDVAAYRHQRLLDDLRG